MNTHKIIPMQPFIIAYADEYNKLDCRQMGISHFYEFKMTKQSIDGVPDGCIDLLFQLDGKNPKCYLSGTVFHAKHWEMGNAGEFFGVRFLPGEGILPDGIQMEDILNDDIEIDADLYGKNLLDKLFEAEDFKKRSELFCDAYQKLYIEKQCETAKKQIDNYIKKRILQTNGMIAVKDLAMEACYSECYIRRIFKQYNGMLPKKFAQFVQFQNFLKSANSGKSNVSLALDCGYYDEAHMVKTFKKYTGITLETYRKIMK